MNYLIDC